ncbi:MAG: hypothetical protein IK093_06340 [Ruminiclostridium sp.]|nr:hypothetical protein [Ruminiclostridium sp.]
MDEKITALKGGSASSSAAVSVTPDKRIPTMRDVLDSFVNGGNIIEPVETGFPMLDKALGGGLFPGITYLGAEPSLGKSTFAFQLAANIAAGERDVIICSLEMQKSIIFAKLISRNTFLMNDREHAVSAIRILDKKSLSAEERSVVEDATKLLSDSRSGSIPVIDRLYVRDDPMDCEEICRFVNDVIEHIGKDAPRPVVIIDYLQKIRHQDIIAGNERAAVDSDIDMLHSLAKEQNLCVFLISSLNRGSYQRHINSDSFKETGKIEYSADTLIGLQYRAVRRNDGYGGKMNGSVFKAESARSPRDVELVVMKQRLESSGAYVPFDYYAEFDCFVQRSEEAAEDTSFSALREPRHIGYTKASLYINNTKLWYDSLLNNKPVKGKKENVRVSRNTKDNENITVSYTVEEMSEPLTYFDAVVSDAVYSVYLDKQASDKIVISLGELLYRMTGKHIRLTGEKKRILWKSLYRLAAMKITINCEAENKARGLTDRKSEISGSLLDVRGIGELFPDGVGDDAELPAEFELAGKSPLFEYAEPLKQIIKVPVELLDAGRKFSDNEEMIMIKHYLVKRLENLNRLGKSHRIAFIDSKGEVGDIMGRLGEREENYKSKSTWLHKLKKVIEKTGAVLDRYVDICYINDYKMTGGKKVTSIVLVPAMKWNGRKKDFEKVYVYDHNIIFSESEPEKPNNL